MITVGRQVAGMRVCAARAAPQAQRRGVAARAASRGNRRNLFAGLSVAVGLLVSQKSEAVTIDELMERTKANKEVNDKKRLATSYANLARSRTVDDGTCEFPKNFIGCENLAELDKVKFLSDDLDIECEGTADGAACRSKRAGSPPSFLGL